MRGPDDALRAEALGRRVRAKRKAAGLTQVDAAAGAGIDRVYLWRLESGRANPSIAVLLRLCEAIAADPCELVGGLELLHDDWPA